jgi:PKD repeat protein
MRNQIRRGLRGRAATLTLLAALLAFNGCGLDEVELPSELFGPAGLGTNIKLTASPDVLVADGRNRATITATVRDQTGSPAGGRPIFFAITDESGFFADLGSLSEETVVTDGNGVARTIYTTPPRPDATADQSVLVAARPVGEDANSALYRNVRIELRSAEPRLFPQNPSNQSPNCSFIVEPATGPYGVNTSVLFQTTSSDQDGTIVRYEWNFGDGTRSDQPDEEHHWGAPGVYEVTHAVTDDDGGQDVCSPVAIAIVN